MLKQQLLIASFLLTKEIYFIGNYVINIEGHVCWNNYCWLFLFCWPRKTNFSFPSVCQLNKWKFAISVFNLQKTNKSCHFPCVCVCVCVRVHVWMCVCVYIYAQISNGKWKTEALPICLNPFTVCSSCKRKFKVNPFVNEESNRSLQTDHADYMDLPIYGT